MGLTGSGKSSVSLSRPSFHVPSLTLSQLINLITQSSNPLKVGHSLTSCTDTVIMAEPFTLDGRRVYLFDTPGFDDTGKSEQEVLRMIALMLEAT